MLNFARLFLITLLLMVSLGMSVSATDDASVEELEIFLGMFGLDGDDLDYGASDSDIQSYSEYMQILEATEEDFNVFGSFSFSGGLDKTRFSTFACSKSLVGYGEEDTVVGLLVYTEDYEVIDSSYRLLGASGLYSAEISFAENQTQYLSIAVREGDVVIHRIYEVTTKEEATKSLLENLEINFVPIVEEIEETEVPVFLMPSVSDLEF